MRRTIPVVLGAAAACAAFMASSSAQAGIAACGNIHVEASAECKMEGGIECEARCTPVSLEASCAAELHAQCEGECNASLEVECTDTCLPSCSGRCEVDPGAFDCRAECQGDCEGSCQGTCGDSECEASCVATCSGECEASCDVDLPEADCDAQCEACCGGFCTAEANIDCQVSCQAAGYAECKAEIEGGCKADCQTEEGALFCDGQYVDHGGKLEECVDALRELFDIEVEGYARGECSNGKCEGEAGGSLSCSATIDGRRDESAPLALLALGLLGLRRRN